MSSIIVKIYHSPCGRLLLGSLGRQLCLCDWMDAKDRSSVLHRLQKKLDREMIVGHTEIIEVAEAQLKEYFKGLRSVFDIPLLMVGTEFQQKVWKSLQRIPYGRTVSYSAIAGDACLPYATRAVANAIGANALSIFVPCHRVIGVRGTLTGYAGGLSAKEYLLSLESSFSRETLDNLQRQKALL